MRKLRPSEEKESIRRFIYLLFFFRFYQNYYIRIATAVSIYLYNIYVYKQTRAQSTTQFYLLSYRLRVYAYNIL